MSRGDDPSELVLHVLGGEVGRTKPRVSLIDYAESELSNAHEYSPKQSTADELG